MRLSAAGAFRLPLILFIAPALLLLIVTGCERPSAHDQTPLADAGNKPQQVGTNAIPTDRPTPDTGSSAGISAYDAESKVEAVAATGEAAFGRFTPFYSEPITAASPGKPSLQMYAGSEAPYKIVSKLPGWIGVDSYYGTVWVPEWYVREDVPEAVELREASLIMPGDEASFSLYPDSSLKWPADDWADFLRERTGGPIAILAWHDWVGVIIPPANDYDGSGVNRPALLWVQKSDLTDISPVAEGGLMKDGQLPIDTVRYITEVALQPGVRSEQVLGLLGEADSQETSGNLNETGKPMRLGTDWRYERPDGQLVVTFSEDGLLKRGYWTLPLTNRDQTLVAPYQYPQLSYEFRPFPLVYTSYSAPDWSARSDLPLTFLYGSAGNTLLLFADDGGFSGMHYDSQLFAVDRQTGRKLWQIDGGYNEIRAIPDRDGKSITVYTRYNPAAKREEQLLRRMRLSDGKIIWQKTLQRDTNQSASHMAGARGVIVTYYQPFEQTKGGLSVWDAATGSLKWERVFDEPFSVLSRGEEDSRILLLRGNTLEALDPDTGHSKWQLAGVGAPAQDSGAFAQPLAEPAPNPLAVPEPERWILLGNERVLVDTESGQALNRYTIKSGEDIEVVDNRYWIIRKPLDTDKYWTATRFESELYDAIAGRAVWTIEGRASGAAMDKSDGTVYLLLENIPAALRAADGKLIWKMDNKAIGDMDESAGSEGNYVQPRYLAPSAFHNDDNLLLLSYGSNLLSVDRRDGSVLYRMPDIMLSYSDSLVELDRSGLVNHDERYLYIGSSNGSFYRLDKAALSKESG